MSLIRQGRKLLQNDDNDDYCELNCNNVLHYNYFNNISIFITIKFRLSFTGVFFVNICLDYKMLCQRCFSSVWSSIINNNM